MVPLNHWPIFPSGLTWPEVTDIESNDLAINYSFYLCLNVYLPLTISTYHYADKRVDENLLKAPMS